MNPKMEFMEFFAGGGFARLGLGGAWRCVFANDMCPKKAASYRKNFHGAPEFHPGDVWEQTAGSISGQPQLAWASFPCQDLSLAGRGNGLSARRSGSFWGFWRIMVDLAVEFRKVPIVVLENVTGLLSSKDGADFALLCERIVEQGYQVGALVIDAVRFTPQSRPRLFLVACSRRFSPDPQCLALRPDGLWHPDRLRDAHDRLPQSVRDKWVWWTMPHPPRMKVALKDILLEDALVQRWHRAAQTRTILSHMSTGHRAKVTVAQQSSAPVVGTIYKRTRIENGRRVQRAEVRFDGISGCLRTPAGGSSRQTVIKVHGRRIRTRLLDSREAARLMGVPDTYALPSNYNDAYHLVGDGVAVPAVAWLSQHLLLPLARRCAAPGAEA